VNLDPKHVLAALVALVILAAIGAQTSQALRQSGTWTIERRPARPTTPDPYARFEAQIASLASESSPTTLRDPFSPGRATAPAPRLAARPKPTPPPPQPVLTAILHSEADPRALLRYDGRDYTVRAGDLFAVFRVVSIAPGQVVLDRDGQRLILHRPTKGE
jgi:hypothetical protein